ncbi:hypothetical protein RZS08_10565 [Arthrospira platensis SPKY1]|nr:hypothetical protein [Arthrospira platensis SPKY1]
MMVSSNNPALIRDTSAAGGTAGAERNAELLFNLIFELVIESFSTFDVIMELFIIFEEPTAFEVKWLFVIELNGIVSI